MREESPLISIAAAVLIALAAGPVGADILISEFMAVNDGSLQDEDGDDSDWIEVSNTGPGDVNLDGWFLTDDAAVLGKWQFPAVMLAAGEELIVFASNKDRRDRDAELHANFRLTSAGEYLAIVQPDGVTVGHDYGSAYPPQFPDVSYGLAVLGGQTVSLIGPGASAKFTIPSGDGDDVNNPAVVTPWNDPAFVDPSWTATDLGVGYARGATEDDYDEFIGTNGEVEGLMDGLAATAYVRVPFTVVDPSEVASLTLRVRYDDGFAAYINGGNATVAGMNAPADGALSYLSVATAGHPDIDALALEPFPIDLSGVTLVAGTNLLAVHGMNRSAGNSDFLIDCELEAVLVPNGGVAEAVYMVTATPGSPNAGGVTDLGPIFHAVTEARPALNLPADSEIVVSAELAEATAPITSVTGFYRQMFGGESSKPMLDDGVPPDALAGDGVYSASIPTAGLSAGEMLRWRFEAADTNATVSRSPLFNDPLNSAEFYGTIGVDPGITSAMPVVHWFVQNTGAADTRAGTRASAWFEGEFYDNFFVRIRGGSTSGFPKKSYKFDFNTRGHFRFDPAAGRAEEINLNQTWSDKAYIRQQLSFEMYDSCGAPGSESFLVRLHRNGVFHSINAFVEQPDKRLLKREGLDDAGALYKMFNTGTSGTSGVEKKNRKHENNADLTAFLNGMNGSSGAALERFLFDNVDVPRQLNYLVATVLAQSNDNMAKNYYLYRDSDGTGEWFQMPWDTDLAWGSHFMTNDSSAHDGIWATQDYVLGGRNQNAPISPSHPFVGTQELPGNRSWNRLIDKLYDSPRFAEMFRRRLRTAMDDYFAAPVLDERIAALRLLIARDAAQDRLKWGQFGQSQTLTTALGILENDYLAPRRNHLFVTHLDVNAGAYPTPQTTSAQLPSAQGAPQIDFGAFEENPASGNQDEEFIELQNPNAFAVDLSGWRVAGGVGHSFLPGTVIEAGGSLYLSPRVPTFRARSTSPTGGEGNFVQGDYEGQISSRGETIALLNSAGGTVDTLVTPANPSEAQLYLRITEILFAPLGGTAGEFIELKNIGPAPLNLEGVHFSDGVTFTFGAGASLGAGELGLLVSDPANFPGANVLGTYTGGLQNSGEQVTLRDAVGENIQSFNYVGLWLPPAVSSGYSLEILDDTLPWDSWDLPVSWALSCAVGGSPDMENPLEHSVAFEGWQRLVFSEAELADDAVSGPDSDASGDGISNLLKYALGLDPHLNTGAGMPEAVIFGGSGALSFRRLVKAADLDYVVEQSTDLVMWGGISTLAEPPVDQGDGTELVTILGDPVAGNVRQFFRLRVTKE